MTILPPRLVMYTGDKVGTFIPVCFKRAAHLFCCYAAVMVERHMHYSLHRLTLLIDIGQENFQFS